MTHVHRREPDTPLHFWGSFLNVRVALELPTMKRAVVAILLLCAACAGQVGAPMKASEVPQRKEILRNHRVTASLLELAPRDATPMHQHDRDMITVFVNGGRTQSTLFGQKPTADHMAVGEVRFRHAGLVHAIKNEGAKPFRTVTVEFEDPQGKLQRKGTASQSCEGGSKACVHEKYLFCTVKVCVEDVNMAPGAVSTRHSHPTDHMLIAVSDYALSDKAEGRDTILRKHKSGEVEYLPAGITHQLTNTSNAYAHFIVIIWR